MTYVPPDRGEEPALDQTRQLDVAPSMPTVGNGVDAPPVDPFAGQAATTVGYAEAPAPRDRLLFQFIWEGILLLLTANALFLVYRDQDAIFGASGKSAALEGHFADLTALLLIATGFALTLRLGAVNLAVPAMPALALLHPQLFVGENPLMGLAYTAGAVLVLTLVHTLLAVVFRIPAWLAGVALLILIAGGSQGFTEVSEALGADTVGSWSDPGAMWPLIGAGVLSIGGGLIALSPAVRDRFTRVKAAVDGTGPRDGGSVLALMGGTFLALLLGALAGFLPTVFGWGSAADLTDGRLFGMYWPAEDAVLTLTPLVLIVVFLAGTSPWGRRGDVFGTVLAAVAVWGLYHVWLVQNGPEWDSNLYMKWIGALYVGLLLLGLFVAFGLDRLGRPKEVPEPERPLFTGEMAPFDSPHGGVDDSVFEPTLPDANGAPR